VLERFPARYADQATLPDFCATPARTTKRASTLRPAALGAFIAIGTMRLSHQTYVRHFSKGTARADHPAFRKDDQCSCSAFGDYSTAQETRVQQCSQHLCNQSHHKFSPTRTLRPSLLGSTSSARAPTPPAHLTSLYTTQMRRPATPTWMELWGGHEG
jgi:hypothetical protein